MLCTSCAACPQVFAFKPAPQSSEVWGFRGFGACAFLTSPSLPLSCPFARILLGTLRFFPARPAIQRSCTQRGPIARVARVWLLILSELGAFHENKRRMAVGEVLSYDLTAKAQVPLPRTHVAVAAARRKSMQLSKSR